MLKKIIVISMIVVVALCFIYGLDGAKGLIYGGKEMIKNTINDNTSTMIDVGRIQSLIRNEGEKISEFADKINDLKSKLIGEELKINRLQESKKEQIAALVMAKDLMDQKKEKYVISGEEYTFADVEINAEWRVDYVKIIEERIAFSKSLVTDLSLTYKSCQASLIEAKKNLGSKQAELKKLQAREISADIRARAKRLSDSLEGLSDSVISQSALQEAFEIYEKKIAKKEMAGSDFTASAVPVSISYDTESVDKQSTMDKINSILSQ